MLTISTPHERFVRTWGGDYDLEFKVEIEEGSDSKQLVDWLDEEKCRAFEQGEKQGREEGLVNGFCFGALAMMVVWFLEWLRT
jgi:hypothetical protein